MIAIWNLLFFIVLIGILVTVHEYGHYIVARKCGVKVLRFSIGFGKPLFRWSGKQGTEYVLAMIPLGGYVKMLDARMGDVTEEEHDLAFNFKPVTQRIAIVAAGPLFNFLFAIFAFWLMYLIGMSSIKPIIGQVEPGSIAFNAGLDEQQQIVAINDVTTKNWQHVQLELSNAIGHESAQISVIDSPTSKPKHIKLDLADWQPQPDKESLITSIGLTVYRPELTTEVALVADSSPATGLLQVNDKFLAINNTLITNWSQIDRIIKSNPEQWVNISLIRDGKEIELNVKLGVRETANNLKQGFLGIVPKSQPWPEEYKQLEQYSFFEGFVAAVDKTWRTIKLSFAMVGKLLTGDVSLQSLSGPVSIAQGAGTTASYGLVHFLSFMAFISVNLGIVNLLPLPVLDGGHLMFHLIEFVRGKPVSEKIQEFGFRLGMMALLGLMSIAILNDLSRL